MMGSVIDAAPQHYQMIAVQFDDAALIDPGVLRIRSGLSTITLRFLARLVCGRRRGRFLTPL